MLDNMTQYKEQLKNNNLKVTDKRLKLIEILDEEEKYMSAKDIQQRLNEYFPAISYDTIYRNLHTLTEIDILEKRLSDTEMLYKIACTTHHHHHFICEKCGDIKVIHHCPIDEWKKELKGATLKAHKVELYGYCGNC